ncbi:MAG: hypothetical protein E4H26_06235 [Flavobacteriales bacterium]|nr:MAG: hypothetical protein E4H26_06235 [Flavobacteriales bacterium]
MNNKYNPRQKKKICGLENKAIEMGINRIQLELEKHNIAAKALDLRHGFKDSGRYLFAKKMQSDLL